jgi:hypothetical protein
MFPAGGEPDPDPDPLAVDESDHNCIVCQRSAGARGSSAKLHVGMMFQGSDKRGLGQAV